MKFRDYGPTAASLVAVLANVWVMDGPRWNQISGTLCTIALAITAFLGGMSRQIEKGNE